MSVSSLAGDPERQVETASRKLGGHSITGVGQGMAQLMAER